MADLAGDFVMFGRSLRQGLYSATILARSSEQPGRDHTYTVGINAPGGIVKMEGVAPDPTRRWSTPFPTLNLVPFAVGAPVEVHVIGTPGSLRAFITTSELPNAGACT
jgi:hypothetical protein